MLAFRRLVHVLWMMPWLALSTQEQFSHPKTSTGGQYSLHLLSYLQLPTGIYKDTPVYGGLNQEAALAGAYDRDNSILYIIGQHMIHVVDIADTMQPNILLSKVFPANEGSLAAVDICNGQLAVSMSAQVKVEPGKIVFYETHTAGENITDLTKLGNITVGAQPKHVKYTRDCTKLVVLNDGEPGLDSSNRYQDPEATVSIIVIRGTSYHVTSNINFREYDYGAVKYNQNLRVPSMFIPRSILATPTLFSRDAQPGYTVIAPDDETAFVTLPKNNAVAKLNISSAAILDIVPLPLKDWTGTPIDASDDDGGVHRRFYSGLLSIRQPTVARLLSIGTSTYMFTGDTGTITSYTKAKHGFVWSDATLASNLVIDRTQSDLKANTANIEKLGRLQVSRIDGKNFYNEEYRHIVAFGGRGFSVWDSADLSAPVYDTGGMFESYMEAKYKTVFNCDYNAAKETYDSPENLRDSVSDNMGGQVTALDVKRDSNTTFLVAGSSSTGMLYLYTVDESSGQPLPVFQQIYRSGLTDLPWRDLYRNATAGDLYINDIGIISSEESPTNKPLVYVISKGSGSLSLYEIR